MTTEFEKSGEQSHKPQSDSFLEPRTIPKKWDVSAFVSHLTSSRKENADQPDESANPVEIDTVEDDESDVALDPFPQPRTIPGKWDVSDLV
jgi:hypothetical protein